MIEHSWDNIEPLPWSGCWIWLGKVVSNGYGRFDGDYIHRIFYRRYKGAIPAGLDIDHLCRNRDCCNPDPLEAVTRRVNLRRGVGFIAQNAKKTHCKNGHELTGANLYTRKDRLGTRECRTCRRSQSAYYNNNVKGTLGSY